MFFHFLEFFQAFDAGLDGLEVRQHATEPALRDVEHAAPLRHFDNDGPSLLLRTHEEDGLPFLDGRAHGFVRDFDLTERFLQIDDVDIVTLGEYELFHLRVPASGLVTEVNAGVK